MLVEVWRSGFLESVHRGALVVVGPDGAVLSAVGEVERPVLPRSANKPVQATALLAAGWTPRSGEELAIGAGSHSGEDGHRELVAGMLAAAGLGPDDLGCPLALPLHDPDFAAWLAAGREPERLAMNCSGKHAAMLSACVAAGWPTEGYLDREHPLQQAIEARLGEVAGTPVAAVVVDGCGAPHPGPPLTALARSVSSLAEAAAGTSDRAAANAIRPHPGAAAGPGREATDLTRASDGRLSKGGADGVRARAAGGRRGLGPGGGGPGASGTGTAGASARGGPGGGGRRAAGGGVPWGATPGGAGPARRGGGGGPVRPGRGAP